MQDSSYSRFPFLRTKVLLFGHITICLTYGLLNLPCWPELTPLWLWINAVRVIILFQCDSPPSKGSPSSQQSYRFYFLSGKQAMTLSLILCKEEAPFKISVTAKFSWRTSNRTTYKCFWYFYKVIRRQKMGTALERGSLDHSRVASSLSVWFQKAAFGNLC